MRFDPLSILEKNPYRPCVRTLISSSAVRPPLPFHEFAENDWQEAYAAKSLYDVDLLLAGESLETAKTCYLRYLWGIPLGSFSLTAGVPNVTWESVYHRLNPAQKAVLEEVLDQLEGVGIPTDLYLDRQRREILSQMRRDLQGALDARFGSRESEARLDLAALKRKVHAADVIGRYTHLAKQGRNLVGKCPWHAQRTGSLTVDPQKDVWYCHSCQKGGDVIAFLEQREQLNFREALRYLATHYGG